MKFLKNDYIKFGIAAIIYTLWVIWLDNYWFLLGLGIIFDIYITKRINWAFWKKREGKNSTIIEWLDALIFAVIAVTIINIFLFQNYKIPSGSMEKSLLIGDHLYVSKVAYGPRLPNTPLSFPFKQNTLPFTKSTKSYLDWIKFPYKRLKGFSHVHRDDAVVFNFPAGDTVCLERTNASYYSIIRDIAMQLKLRDEQNKEPVKSDKVYHTIARNYVWNTYHIVVRPVDKEDNYVKRCVAVAGDTLEIVNGKVYTNGKPQKEIPGLQYKYRVNTNGTRINPLNLEKLGIYESDIHWGLGYAFMEVPLTAANVEKIKEFKNVVNVDRYIQPKGVYEYSIFPHSPDYPWNLDNFGPLYIPKKGVTIDIDTINIVLYKRIIGHYEHNDLRIENGKIYINGKEAAQYTFKMNYYWMMGDNRNNSLDSRYWGFVPEDHVVGKPKFIWLSLNKNKKFLGKIRLNRMFKVIH